MKEIRPRVAVTVLAIALVAAASWLLAGPEPEATQEPAPAAVASEGSPLPDFEPSEKLPADSAVAFPTDI